MGENIYKKASFGQSSIESGALEQPYFVDLAVDQYGVINALDAMSRKIYQYDQEGNLLAVFGGQGDVKSRFEYPVSIVTDKAGKVYVLDRDRNNIQIFQPTRFADLIHQASQLHFNGRYQEALGPVEGSTRDRRELSARPPRRSEGADEGREVEGGHEGIQAGRRSRRLFESVLPSIGMILMRQYLGWLLIAAALIIYAVYLIVKFLIRVTNTVIRRYGY